MIVGLIVAGSYLFVAGVTCGICQYFLEFCQEESNQPASAMIGLVWPFSLPAVCTLLLIRWLRPTYGVREEWTAKEEKTLLSSLPDDAAEGFEQLRLAIRQHRADGWRDISKEDMLDVLDLLEHVVEAKEEGLV